MASWTAKPDGGAPMRPARPSLVLLALLLVTAPAATVAQPSQRPGPSLSASIEDLERAKAPGADPLIAYTARFEAHGEDASRAATDAVSPTDRFRPAVLEGIPAGTPYEWMFRAWSVPRPAAGIAWNTGGAIQHWAYAAADAGTPLADGDTKEVAVAALGPDPLYPPATTQGGGEIQWTRTDPLSKLATTHYQTPPVGPLRHAETAVAFATPTLAVSAPGIAPEETLVIPNRTLVVPDLDMSMAATVYPAAPPGVDLSLDVTYEDVDTGPTYVNISGTIEPGSTWPASGQDGGHPTWIHRIELAIVGQPVDDGGTSSSPPPSPAARTLQLGPRLPGTRTLLTVEETGETRPVPAGPGATVTGQAGPDIQVHAETWSVGSAPGLPSSPSQSSAGLDGSCGSEYVSPARGESLSRGLVRFNLTNAGIEASCLDGQTVGGVHLAQVTVDGRAHRILPVGESPVVKAKPGGARIVLHHQAGPIELESELFVFSFAGQLYLRPLQWDVHALDGREHSVELNWNVDPDPGPGERLLVEGQVPQRIEGPVPTEPVTDTSRLVPHVIEADDGRSLSFFALNQRTPIAIDRPANRQETSGPALAAHLQPAVPPERLEDDVALIQPARYAGTHMAWPHGGQASELSFLLRDNDPVGALVPG